MPHIPFYQVDAFADRLFAGNPAAVCPLDAWLPVEVMQAVAAENNLSETAFTAPQTDGAFGLRWFTPEVEVALCGHATLAAAHVHFTHRGHDGGTIGFETKSGRLTVARTGEGRLSMDFPAVPIRAAEAPAAVIAATGGPAPEAAWIVEVDHGADVWMLLYPREAEVANLAPDHVALSAARANVLVTAPGDGCDFVSRYFAINSGIPEDPVTGSTHCALGPFWAERIGRAKLKARQISRRGGDVGVTVRGDRVDLVGACVDVIAGVMRTP